MIRTLLTAAFIAAACPAYSDSLPRMPDNVELIENNKAANEFNLFADDTHVSWGVVNQSIMHIAKSDDAAADIVITNTLTMYGPNSFTADLTMDGITVRVQYNSGRGDGEGNGEDPDTVYITPPPGYIAIPSEIFIDEETTVVIKIYPALLG